MITTLLTLFFIANLAGIIFLVAWHLPTVSSLRPEELAHIRHQQLKARLILHRLDRTILDPLQRFILNLRPLLQRWSTLVPQLLQRLKAIEHYYEKLSLQRKRTAVSAGTVAEQVTALCVEARAFFEKELFEEAERKYIAAVAFDPKSMEAYEGLGELYFAKKDYDAARATYAHIVKLNERNAAAYARLGAIASASGNLPEAEQDYEKALALSNDLVSSHLDLGEVHRTMGKHEEALKNFLDARAIESRNPRVLDALLETAIMVKNKVLAEEVFAELKAVNPENQKLAEIAENIQALPVAEEVEKKGARKRKGL